MGHCRRRLLGAKNWALRSVDKVFAVHSSIRYISSKLSSSKAGVSLSKVHFRKPQLLSTKGEGKSEIGKCRLRAQSIYNAASTFCFLLSTLHIHILITYSTTTMASIYDKLAQAKYEEKLKVTILGELIGVLRCFTSDISALAKSCYGHGEPSDITFDVVTGFDDDKKPGMLAWVISYTKLDGITLNWDARLRSEYSSSIEDSYQSLIRGLQSMMVELLG